MTEEQLRDVLARVVPEPPESVADPAPVVRAARVRRRVQVALAGGVVAVVAVAGVLGGRALTGDDSSPQVANEPSLSGDPYSAASCPDVLPESAPLPDLAEVTAVRYCAAGFNGFPAGPGPADALVSGVDDLEAAIAEIPNADPARCAAVAVLPSDSRLAFELADGSLAFVPATMCTDVTVDGRTVDGAEVSGAFMAAIDAQRDEHTYTVSRTELPDCSDGPTSVAPYDPARDPIIRGVLCETYEARGELTAGQLDLLNERWREAVPYPGDVSKECRLRGEAPYAVFAVTSRGDYVAMWSGPCALSVDAGYAGSRTYNVPLTAEEVAAWD